MPQIGDTIAGKYRIERLIGQGAFATVWAASNLFIERMVALKILAEAPARRKTTVARFLKEARLCATPIHPVIVTVEDIGQTEEGLPFLVMELLEGHTLDSILRTKGALPWSMVLEISKAVVEGLAAAHERDIIHRDIKPSNLFLVRSTELGPPVRVLDLGLARDLSDDKRLTHTGQVVGTANYLPPETLLDEQPKGGTKAGDVFAMGMVMFVSLTGRFPFFAERAGSNPAAEVYARAKFYKNRQPLPGPRLYDPSVPPALDELVEKALSIDASARYADAGEMLEAFIAAEEELAQRASRESFTGGVSLAQTRIDSSTPPRDDESFEEPEIQRRSAMAWEALLDFASVQGSVPPPEVNGEAAEKPATAVRVETSPVPEQAALSSSPPGPPSRPSDRTSRPSDRSSRPSDPSRRSARPSDGQSGRSASRESRSSRTSKSVSKSKLQMVFLGAALGTLVGVLILGLIAGWLLLWRDRGAAAQPDAADAVTSERPSE